MIRGGVPLKDDFIWFRRMLTEGKLECHHQAGRCCLTQCWMKAILDHCDHWMLGGYLALVDLQWGSKAGCGDLVQLVFESPVRSGLLPSRGLDQDQDWSSQVEKPPKTRPNWCKLVCGGLGRFFVITRLVSTSYSWDRFVTSLDWSFQHSR